MKKVLLRSYIMQNLGDDLFIKIICERYKDVKFYVHGKRKYRHIFNDVSNLHYIKDYTIFKYINLLLSILKLKSISRKLLPQVDATVFLGGSIYIQYPDWKLKCNLDKYNASLFDKSYVIGANFGPYDKNDYLDAYKNCFENITDVCFRDKYSKNLFPQLDNVRYASDVIFQLTPPKDEIENYYIISIINCGEKESLGDYHENYVNNIKDIATEFVKKGSRVVLMSFCEEEGDTKTAREIYNQMPIYHRKYVEVYTHTNINNSLSKLNKCKGIVATRFHSMIIGFILEKPMIPIIYSEKALNVLNDIKFKGIYYNLENINSANKEELVCNIEKQFEMDTQKLHLDSEKQFYALDKFLLD